MNKYLVAVLGLKMKGRIVRAHSPACAAAFAASKHGKECIVTVHQLPSATFFRCEVSRSGDTTHAHAREVNRGN